MDAGATTKYIVDPKGFLPQVIAEMDSGGNITSYYVYDGIGLVAKMTPSGSTYFYHYNGSGNTIAMTDASGNMVNKYAYDEFGNLVNVEESIPNPFLFVGQYGVMDDNNVLLYMRARYYDPEVGRFINKDPLGFDGGINPYTYVANNSVNRIDPYGLWSFSIGAYYGYGGTITVGSDSGKTFIMVEAGVGIGGKAKYKPFGKFPDVPCKEKSDAGAFIGVGGGVGVYGGLPILGALSLFLEGKLVLGVSKTGDLLQTNYIEEGAPEVGIQKKGWGFGLGIHGGVQVGVLF